MKIIVFNVPTQGHINPTLPIVSALVKRNVEVIYYLTEGQRRRIEATGATFRAYEMVQDDYFESQHLDGSNPPLTARTMIETSRDLLPTLLDVVRHEKPDLLLNDAMCAWGWLVAKQMGIPSVTSLSTLALTPQLILQSGQFFTLMNLMLKNFKNLWQFNRIASEIGRQYHVQTPGFTDALSSSGTITLNYTSALVQPGAKMLGTGFKFVGPLIEPRPDETNFPFDQLGDKPLIYISLGTVINSNHEFYAECLRAFANSDYQIVMSVGRKIDIAELGAIPANFIVRGFVPQLDILQRAALFITHAGMNSVHEGLYYNVPLLLVPQQTEQGLVANRVQQLGAGINLATASPSAALLRDSAQRLFSDSRFRERAKIVGDSLRTAGGTRQAVDEIMMLGQKSAGSV